MSVISTFAAVPNRVAIVFRYLQGYEDGIQEEELKALLTPRGLSSRGGEEDSPATLAAHVLLEVKALHLIEEGQDGVVRIPSNLRGLDDQGLLEYLERTLLHPESAEQAGQAQFPRALAWLLVQDPAQPLAFRENHPERVMKDCGEDSGAFGLTNSQRFQNFTYWARYLGYAWRFELKEQSDLVVPDPAPALARHIQSVLQSRKEAPVDELMSLLAERSPVLEGGRVRSEVEARLPSEKRRAEGTLSRSTSLALFRLERRGIIRLERRADAPAIRLASWPDERAVSHVIFLGSSDGLRR